MMLPKNICLMHESQHDCQNNVLLRDFKLKISPLLRRKLTGRRQKPQRSRTHTTGMTAMQYGQKCNACLLSPETQVQK